MTTPLTNIRTDSEMVVDRNVIAASFHGKGPERCDGCHLSPELGFELVQTVSKQGPQ
jgi:hypothetical protein